LGIAVYAASLAVAQDQPKAAPAEFMSRAAQYCLAEIQIGEIAQKQAHSVEVADFATRRIDEYSKLLSDLKDLAGKEGVTLPTDLSLSSLNIQAELEGSPSSEAFDALYMGAIRVFQREQLSEFQAQTKYAKDTEVQSLAAKTMPMLKAAAASADRVDAMVEGHTTTARPKTTG
jgi:putative membrane protein